MIKCYGENICMHFGENICMSFAAFHSLQLFVVLNTFFSFVFKMLLVFIDHLAVIKNAIMSCSVITEFRKW